MKRATLSAVMPNYNHAQYLPRAIEGILNQTRPPDEFLILDDASSDHSLEIIESYAAQNASIRVLRSKNNLGVIGAHEKLYRQAQGDYLYSAAADDDRYPNFFEQALELAEQHPQAGLVFGKMVTFDEAGREVAETGARRWQEAVYASPQRYLREFLEVEPPMHALTGATIFRRDAFQAVGWCPPELGSFADTFACRAIALKHGACYVPARFHKWYRLGGSFSQETNEDAKKALDVVAQAAALMRSPRYRDCFPERYVRKWARGQRRQIVWSHWLDAGRPTGDRDSFGLRNLKRLPRLATALRLLTYPGQLAEPPPTSSACGTHNCEK